MDPLPAPQLMQWDALDPGLAVTLLDVGKAIAEAHRQGDEPALVVLYRRDRTPCGVLPVLIETHMQLPKLVMLQHSSDSLNNKPPPPLPPPPAPAPVLDISTTLADDLILQVLRKAEKPLKRISIAHRAAWKNNSYFADRIRRLCELGLVTRQLDHTYKIAQDPKGLPVH